MQFSLYSLVLHPLFLRGALSLLTALSACVLSGSYPMSDLSLRPPAVRSRRRPLNENRVSLAQVRELCSQFAPYLLWNVLNR